jgi:2'-5' RNA ligase
MTMNQTSQRLFFGLWPSAATADEIMAWALDAHALCGGRMMQAEALHMTLAFLGNTPEDKVHELVQAAPGWTVPVGTLQLKRFGRFAGPRVVWAGPSSEDGERVPWLDDAYASLWSHLEGAGWERPASVFRPHVSLLRKAGPCELDVLSRPALSWTPEQCVLVASRPAEGGSRYEILVRLPIRHLAC